MTRGAFNTGAIGAMHRGPLAAATGPFGKIANYDTWFPSVRTENSESGPL